MIEALSDALKERGYDVLTAVQEAVCNPDLAEADLLVSAQTGSGKTVGFGLAIAPTLLRGADRMGPADAPLALIVAPTRELALQVKREIDWLFARTGAQVTTCIGGMDMRDERRALERGAHIVVGTPGRLRDHVQRGSLDLGALRAIVLDEADEMLDLGFREDLEFMLGQAPEDRRTLMFSATVPPMIAKLAQTYQRDAVRVTTLTGGTQHADITYQALQVAQQDAENAIINVLRYHDAQNAIVFANTRAAVNRLSARLTNRAFAVVTLSGELSQSERSHALQAMRDGRARVCVATDVAARGIDLPGLDLVIHAELPSNAEGLLHRSGRTGRAGRKGLSALIVPPKQAKKAERLLKFAKIAAEWTMPPSADDVLRKDEERLLADPVWSEAPTPEQEAFAAKLVAQYSPEQIAAAYVALYRSKHAAPEDLSAPDAPAPARAERKSFGPSVWFALSVGRNDRAEARWLLPLLCRAGQIDKDAIGAIRVQDTESFVELSAASVAGFLAAIGETGTLEDGITVRQLDSAPELAPAPPRKPAPRPYRPEPGSGPKPRKPRDNAPGAGPQGKHRKGPSKMEAAVREGAVKPAGKSAGKTTGKPAGKSHAAKASAPPASGPSGGKPGAGKPWASAPDKSKGKPFGKPRGPAGGAKDTKRAPADAGAPKAAGKPAKRSGPNASDTSKRFSPPGTPGKPRKPKAGGGKPGAGKPRQAGGGNAPPKRR